MKETKSIRTPQRSVRVDPPKPELKTVIALRHGEYDDGTKELNSYGRQQSQALGTRLRKIIPTGSPTLVLSSPYLRAKQTAEIVAQCLQCQVQGCDELQTDEYEHGERVRNALLPLVNGSAVIVLVTHYEAPSGIINAFSQAHFQKRVGQDVSNKGTGMMIDLSTGEISTV